MAWAAKLRFFISLSLGAVVLGFGHNSNNVKLMRRMKIFRHKLDGEDEKEPVLYFDWAATTPLAPEARAAIQNAPWGNPSSNHAYGRVAAKELQRAREQVCAAVGSVDGADMTFTSCGTEANNFIIEAALSRFESFESGLGGGIEPRIPHILSTNIEHPSVAAKLAKLVREGRCGWTRVSVRDDGRVDPSSVAHALTPSTCLVTIMHANNEVGSVNDVATIVKLCRFRWRDIVEPQRAALARGQYAPGLSARHQYDPPRDAAAAAQSDSDLLELLFPSPWFHSDAAQSFGKLPYFEDIGVDFLTLVGHKIGAPKGIGALWQRNATQWRSDLQRAALLTGGGQENGFRGGTEAMISICALGAAAEAAVRAQPKEATRLEELRTLLLESIVKELGESCQFLGSYTERISMLQRSNLNTDGSYNKDGIYVWVNGAESNPMQRVPHILSLGIASGSPTRIFSAAQLVEELGDSIAFSAGAACHSSGAEGKPSSVLLACGLTPDDARATIRLSLGVTTTEREVHMAASRVAAGILRQILPAKDIGGTMDSSGGGSSGIPEPPPARGSRYEDYYRMSPKELREKFQKGVEEAVRGEKSDDIRRGLVPQDPDFLFKTHAATMTDQAKSSDGVIDTKAEPIEGTLPSTSNAFFAGYSEGDLESLWNMHKAITNPKDVSTELPEVSLAKQDGVGCQAGQAGDSTQQKDNLTSSSDSNAFSGLHELVVQNIDANSRIEDAIEDEKARRLLGEEARIAMEKLMQSKDNDSAGQ